MCSCDAAFLSNYFELFVVFTVIVVRVFIMDSSELMHAHHYPAASLAGASGEAARLSAAHQQQGMQTSRRGANDGTKPPKKPLTPYMIFSKRVSYAYLYLHLVLITNLFLYLAVLTKPLGMQARCMSQARINCEGCSRKGIRRKNVGMREVGR